MISSPFLYEAGYPPLAMTTVTAALFSSHCTGFELRSACSVFFNTSYKSDFSNGIRIWQRHGQSQEEFCGKTIPKLNLLLTDYLFLQWVVNWRMMWLDHQVKSRTESVHESVFWIGSLQWTSRFVLLHLIWLQCLQDFQSEQHHRRFGT